MIKRRSVLTGLLAGGAATGLSACGGSKDTNSGSKNQASGAAAEGPVEITYMHRLPDGEGMVKVEEIVARWNKENPDIQVKSTKFDGNASEMIVRLENEVKAGTAPDLAQVGYGEIPSLFTKGLLEDVTSEAEKYKGNFAEGAYGLMRAGEVVVGLPQDTGPLVYLYNEAEFERLGISVPKTSDELLDAARKAKADGKYAICFQSDEAQYGLAGQAAAAGAAWYEASSDAWTVNVTSDETAKVAEFWQTALDEKIALTQPRWVEGFTKALVDGTLIGSIAAAWEAALYAGDLAEAESAGKWKVAQIPAFGSEQKSGPDGGSGIGVMKGSKNVEAAMKFADWFNCQIDDLATQGLVVAASGKVSTPESLKKMFGGQEVMEALAEANSIMSADFIYMPTWPAIGPGMVQAAEGAASGSGKVADIFTVAQDESVKSLKDAGLPVSA